jgi:Domain of unknown function (DUF4304)
MSDKLLEKIRVKTIDPAFASLIDKLVERRNEYQQLYRDTRDQIARNRAKREGITFEQVREESTRLSAPYALRPDEIEEMNRREDETVANAASDEKLFRMMWYAAEYYWRLREQDVESPYHPENLPLFRTLYDYLMTDRQLYLDFANAKGWAIPEPIFKKKRISKLKGPQVRAVRLKVAEDVLRPAGFIKGKESSYIRRRGDQVHLIDFQPGKWGGNFTINLGLHYTFLRPAYVMRRISLPDLHLLDCALQERIGFFKPENDDVWFDYGDDKGELRQLIEDNVRLCLAVFDEYGAKWSDPMVLATERSRGIWHPWRVSQLVLAAIRIRSAKQLDLARTELENATKHPWAERAAVVKTMLEELDRVERGEQIPDEDWFTD